MENNWVLLAEIVAAGIILIYLFFRKGKKGVSYPGSFRRIDIKLHGSLQPREICIGSGETVHLYIHRYDAEPSEELFEIDALELYELLPAGHTTIIKVASERRGRFPIVLGAEKEVGVLVIQ